MAERGNRALIQVLKKIPIFNGLSPSQIQKVLSLCKSKSLSIGEPLFVAGSPSDEMYILLTGELLLKKEDGTPITTIGPVTTVGEVGIITREVRKVSIETLKPSTIVRIHKSKFDMLLHDDLDISVVVFKNLVVLLSKRIDNDNVRSVDFESQESRLKRTQKELDITIGLLIEKGQTDKEVKGAISSKLKETLKKVLIVDDDELVRQTFVKALQEFNVSEAEDGEDALAAIDKSLPDVVVADVNMPKMDGLELLSRLKSDFPNLPVIGLSGYVPVDKGENLGFDSFLYKPLSLQVLKQKIVEEMEWVE